MTSWKVFFIQCQPWINKLQWRGYHQTSNSYWNSYPPNRERTLQLSVSHLPLPEPPPFRSQGLRKNRKEPRLWHHGSRTLGPWSHGPWSHGPWSRGPWNRGPWSRGSRGSGLRRGDRGRKSALRNRGKDLLNETIKCPFLSHYIPKMSWFYTSKKVRVGWIPLIVMELNNNFWWPNAKPSPVLVGLYINNIK